MTKQDARQYARQTWEGLTPVRRTRLQKRFSAFLEERARGYRRFFGTVPTAGEVDILSILETKGMPIYLPRAGENGIMSFHYYARGMDRKRLIPGKFGIYVPPESDPVIPDEGDLCVLPSLGCNPDRFRLGRGGGYFDRFFSEHSSAKNCWKVSVLPVELCEILFPEQLHDLKLDELLTDT